MRQRWRQSVDFRHPKNFAMLDVAIHHAHNIQAHQQAFSTRTTSVMTWNAKERHSISLGSVTKKEEFNPAILVSISRKQCKIL